MRLGWADLKLEFKIEVEVAVEVEVNIAAAVPVEGMKYDPQRATSRETPDIAHIYHPRSPMNPAYPSTLRNSACQYFRIRRWESR